DRSTDPTALIVLAVGLGWGFIGTGLYAWWRRPENRMGALMVLVGFTWFLGALGEAGGPWLFSLGSALSNVWIGAFALMLVAFPTGVVGRGLERALVWLGWIAVGLSALRTFVTARPDTSCSPCPRNTLLVWDSGTAADVVDALTA